MLNVYLLVAPAIFFLVVCALKEQVQMLVLVIAKNKSNLLSYTNCADENDTVGGREFI